jgi:hypothetical protein
MINTICDTNSVGFLPDDYDVPTNGGSYLKLREGQNRIRILGSPLLGWLQWEETPEGKRPKRSSMDKKPTGPDVKHFWAMPVWDHQAEKVSILEITQATIQQALRDLAKDLEWGNPREYDVTIQRKGSGLDTEYSVRPSPKTAISQEIRDAVTATPLCLEALFENGNPFEAPPENDSTPI